MQEWYASQCDGDWEHHHGVAIETLDNPGWSITISLDGTDLEERPFHRVQVEHTEDDWLHAWKDSGKWHASCGPLNLTDAVGAFLAWASS